MMINGRAITLVSLVSALALGALTSSPCSYLIAGGEVTLSPTPHILLFRLGDSGEIEVIQSVPASAEVMRVAADPLGRYLVSAPYGGLDVPPTLFALNGDHLSRESVAPAPAGLRHWGGGLAVSPDGSIVTCASKPFSGSTIVSLRSYSVGSALDLTYTGHSLSAEEWGGLNRAVIAPGDEWTFVATLIDQGEVALVGLGRDGAFEGDGVRLPALPAARRLLAGPGLSPDGQWAVVGHQFGPSGHGLISVHLDGLGGGSLAHETSDEDLRSSHSVDFHPSGRCLFRGPLMSTVPFDMQTGLMGSELVSYEVTSQTWQEGVVTCDGRIAFANYADPWGHSVFVTYWIGEDGSLIPAGHEMIGPTTVWNLAVIPPRPLPGDANRDGKVDSADTVAVVRDLTGEQPIYHWIARENADLDADQDVDVDDLEALIRIQLGE